MEISGFLCYHKKSNDSSGSCDFCRTGEWMYGATNKFGKSVGGKRWQ